MSDAQVLAWFDHEREDGAIPKLSRPSGRPTPTSRGLYVRLLFSYGITEPEDVERLWAAEQARRAAAEEAKKPARKVSRGSKPNAPRPRPRR